MKRTKPKSQLEEPKADALRRAAGAALRHLAPVSKAQAAPAFHVKAAAEEGWSVELGAYRDQEAARQALRRVCRRRIRYRQAAAGSGATEIGSPASVSGPAAELFRERRADGLRRLEKAQDRLHGGPRSAMKLASN